jgi:hypothetical protein
VNPKVAREPGLNSTFGADTIPFRIPPGGADAALTQKKLVQENPAIGYAEDIATPVPQLRMLSKVRLGACDATGAGTAAATSASTAARPRIVSVLRVKGPTRVREQSHRRRLAAAFVVPTEDADTLVDLAGRG